MCTHRVFLKRVLSLMLGSVVLTIACGRQISAAEPTSPSVHRIVIVDGGNRRVQYVASGNLSTGDSQALSDLQRAEDELSYVDNLQQLKHQYVRTERSLEPRRRFVQERLYGTRISYGSYGSTYANYMTNPYSLLPGTYGNNAFYGPFGGYGGYGGYGYPGGAMGYGGGSWDSVTNSLQYGMGDEGRMKNAIIGVIAQQASPDYAATVIRNYKDAVDRAAGSSILSRDLGLKKSADTPPPAKSK